MRNLTGKEKIIAVCILIILFCVGFVFGTISIKILNEKNIVNSDNDEFTFYATIESIKQYDDGSFHINVKGLEVNDINYRGIFTFTVDDNINITWRGTNIKVSDLRIRNNISITFTDKSITDIIPTPLMEVKKIQLLDDSLDVKPIKLRVNSLVAEDLFKEYTLSKEDSTFLFNLVETLQCRDYTCDGIAVYHFKIDENNYGIEVYENEFHILPYSDSVSNEAVITGENYVRLKQILDKYPQDDKIPFIVN